VEDLGEAWEGGSMAHDGEERAAVRGEGGGERREGEELW
jgi:hypothetical protein